MDIEKKRICPIICVQGKMGTTKTSNKTVKNEITTLNGIKVLK
jgi:hypothetical protein